MKKHPLRRWRESHEKTMTLDALSVLAGVGKSMLSEIENWNRLPSLELACRLEDITGLHPRSFLRPAVAADQNAPTTEPSDAA